MRGCVVERAARLSSLLEIRGSRVGCRLGGTIPAPGTSPILMLVPLSDHSRGGSTTPVAEQPAAKEGAADGAAARIERLEASVDRWRSRVAPSFFMPSGCLFGSRREPPGGMSRGRLPRTPHNTDINHVSHLLCIPSMLVKRRYQKWRQTKIERKRRHNSA